LRGLGDNQHGPHHALIFVIDRVTMIDSSALETHVAAQVAPVRRIERSQLSPDWHGYAASLNSILKNVKQDHSNYEVAASRCGEQIDDILDGFVGAVIGGFESAVWAMLRVWSVVEAAVGKGSAQPFVEKQK
jgi:hypothetical protein